MQDCVNQRKALIYLMVLLGNSFPQFDKSPGTLVKLVELWQNKSQNKRFHEDISWSNSFENSHDYQSKHDGIRSEIRSVKPKHWRKTIYLHLTMRFRGRSTTPAT